MSFRLGRDVHAYMRHLQLDGVGAGAGNAGSLVSCAGAVSDNIGELSGKLERHQAIYRAFIGDTGAKSDNYRCVGRTILVRQ